jgi:hypothetical protein
VGTYQLFIIVQPSTGTEFKLVGKLSTLGITDLQFKATN